MENTSVDLKGKQKAFLYILLLVYLVVEIVDILKFLKLEDSGLDQNKVSYDLYNMTNQTENDTEFNLTFHTFNVTKNKEKDGINFETYYYISIYSNLIAACIDFLFIILICVNANCGAEYINYCCCICSRADEGKCAKGITECGQNHPLIIQFLIGLLNTIIIIVLMSEYGAGKIPILPLVFYIIAIIATIAYWCLSKFKFNKISIPPINKTNTEVKPQDISGTQVNVNQPESGKYILK